MSKFYQTFELVRYLREQTEAVSWNKQEAWKSSRLLSSWPSSEAAYLHEPTKDIVLHVAVRQNTGDNEKIIYLFLKFPVLNSRGLKY